MSKKWSGPRRLFKDRPGMPDPMPPDVAGSVDKLRKARESIDPFRTYRLAMPGGGVFEATGADLIAHAEATASLADAIRRGEDPRVIRAAFDRLDRTL
jgi:hypothetical protein